MIRSIGKNSVMAKKWYFLLAMLTAVLIVQGLYFFLVKEFLHDWPTRGQFCDLFGALNASFSGLAFMAIAYTIQLQQKQTVLDADHRRESQALALLTSLIAFYDKQIFTAEQERLSGPAAAAKEKLLLDLRKRRSELD